MIRAMCHVKTWLIADRLSTHTFFFVVLYRPVCVTYMNKCSSLLKINENFNQRTISIFDSLHKINYSHVKVNDTLFFFCKKKQSETCFSKSTGKKIGLNASISENIYTLQYQRPSKVILTCEYRVDYLLQDVFAPDTIIFSRSFFEKFRVDESCTVLRYFIQ